MKDRSNRHLYTPQFAVTLLIFSTGKVIVGGTTERNEAKSALQHVEDEITALDGI